jgi:hypothetical protein
MRKVSIYIFYFIGLIFYSSANAALVSYDFVAERSGSSGVATGGSIVDIADDF